ncbi:MAG: bifunctional diaminohydroxyphosphoribosylaminopyrimidine deaminase/5-amino-6-(5-phosphoribosylamino)uracil reductase RibD [bacterium]
MSFPPPEKKYMMKAIEAAAAGIGKTATNPLVGTCLVRDGEILATSAHEKFGDLHAEAALFARHPDKIEGSDLYCTLEPCIHPGKTPPCLPLILNSGLRRIIIAHEDPHPAVAGAGLRALRASGFEVLYPLARQEYRWLNRAYFYRLKTGLPWLELKLALSSDGYIATASHHSRWLSGPESRHHVHELRSRCDAVMVGAGTLREDNPGLTVRHKPCDNQPLAIIITTKSDELPLECKLLTERAAETVIVLPAATSASLVRKLRRRAVTVLLSDLKKGRFIWKQVLPRLAKLDIGRILIEGGGGLAGSLMSAGYLNEAHLFYCGRFLGDGIKSVRLEEKINKVGEGPHAGLVKTKVYGDDLYIQRLFQSPLKKNKFRLKSSPLFFA